MSGIKNLDHSLKPRVAIDLSLANRSLGFSGIPQISRLLFAALSLSESIDLTGVLMSSGESWLGAHLNRLEEQSVFLGPFLNQRLDQSNLIEKIIRRISVRAAHFYRRVVRQYPIHYSLEPFLPTLEKNVIWRTFFQSTIPPELRAKVIESHFVMSSLGRNRTIEAAFKHLPKPKLNTEGFDAMVFQCPRVVQLSEDTQKIIHYHDGLPIFASDTFPNDGSTQEHIRSTQRCAYSSLFVCISPGAQEDLARISPKAAERSCVIPNMLPKMSRVETSPHNLLNIAQLRVSSSIITVDKVRETIEAWFQTNNGMKIPRYIMSLSTLEPRKNYLALLSAWHQLRLSTSIDIKLMIVGSPGWLYKPILQAMQPFVRTGELLHLEKVAQEELSYLYSAAECFAFPSFGEGFSLPPCEAMQCGCPVVLSDIPAHRYSAGNAALYCDPYDTADIAAKLKLVLLDQDKEARCQDMIAKGYANVERFTASAVLPQWEQLFEEVAMRRNKK